MGNRVRHGLGPSGSVLCRVVCLNAAPRIGLSRGYRVRRGLGRSCSVRCLMVRFSIVHRLQHAFSTRFGLPRLRPGLCLDHG